MPGTTRSVAAAALALALIAAACTGSDEESKSTSTTAETKTSTTTAASDCETITATFRSVTSANADLVDPELAVSCDGSTVSVTSNAIPDFVYIESSPGTPTAQDLGFEIPVTATEADSPSDVALLGPIAVAVDGVPIYGPTEATGGDVLSLAGALSDCGGHNGPTGYHFHLFGWADGLDCLYSADEAESGSVLVGWSVDGYPIMSGLVCVDEDCTSTEQLTSSWALTDDSLFATDTWSAHTYTEGSGDLDQCNGRVDSDGQYRYYTTPTFPYFMGCYRGTVASDAITGFGGGPGGPPGA